ncbi:HNH endonuclease [Corynebacterium sp. CCUG 71335]|uniref:HNH endonuclease signature motif containing protein n=1 Tax=unclassified Corynebacterium TaxID=2624378 RepID=UPI00210E3769|nr:MULTISPECIES: HNH endonuclease signature motif containing protein [unclassified Corynebacterium]MCQ4619393.1 HNH endonuclease [Corynebacterium pseudogenitalium]MCQ4619675.1 HNH endonuclease [Corynebacterium sp. CCUG 71335]MCQ4621844.1 HNH endonuclease [Corynebacterium sp. CCUG 70398]
METFDDLVSAFSAPRLGALKDFNKQQALSAGVEPSVVNNWKLVHDAYFGDGLSAAKREKASKKAMRLGLSVGMLAKIERSIAHIKHATRRHTMRLKLLDAASRTTRTFKALGALIKKIVPPKNPPARQERATISEGDDDMATLTLTTGKRFLADLKHVLTAGMGADVSPGAHMARKLIALLRGDGSVPEASPRPMLLVPLPEWTRIVRGDGDDVILGLTDGTTMTGKEFMDRFIATGDNELEAAVFHPTEGAVNLYRTERLANAKQRDLAKAVQPMCAHPDCHHAADFCQVHHAEAWARGGETNIANLVPLCRYHNRINDDAPDVHRSRGHIAIRDGRPVWVSPYGTVRTNQRHRFGAMDALFGPAVAAA